VDGPSSEAPEAIPFNRAHFAASDLELLLSAATRGHTSGNGPLTRASEALLEDLHTVDGRRPTVLLTTSCTHALEMAALLLELRPGDEVIVPSFTFVSGAAAFMLHGGTPVFVDVDPSTMNTSAELIAAAITPRTRAISVVNYAGIGADLDRVRDLATSHGLTLIEDNAHGLGGRWSGQTLGSFGALSTLSFHETKNVTCGEGGALVINDPELVRRAEILREKGTDRARFFRGQVDKYTWVDVGSSWVLSDLLAGLLLGQLRRFDEIQRGRHEIWQQYATRLVEWAGQEGVILPTVPLEASHTAHIFTLRFDDIEVRTMFIDHLARADIKAVFHYQPLHLSAVATRTGAHPSLPVTERLADTLVRLPLFVEMTSADVDRVIKEVQSFRAPTR